MEIETGRDMEFQMIVLYVSCLLSMEMAGSAIVAAMKAAIPKIAGRNMRDLYLFMA